MFVLTVTNTTSGCSATDTTRVLKPDYPSGGSVSVAASCYGENTGMITIQGISGGMPPYLISLNGNPFSQATTFENLSAGNYFVLLQDAAGCEWDTTVQVPQLPEVLLDLGPDISIDLGQEVQLDAQTNLAPFDINEIFWDPIDWLDCLDCLDPTVVPLSTVTYNLTITDGNGCPATDDVTIFVDESGGVYIPNGFSPNGDGNNDIFLINAGPGVKEITVLKIFDRWGELVYEGYNFPPNDPLYGWDGVFRGQDMNPAVFAYFTIVEFIDGNKRLYKGDVTLVR